jgi:hypothetical protein
MPEPGDSIRIENGSHAGEYEVTLSRPTIRTTFRSALREGLRGQTNDVAFFDDQAFFRNDDIPTGMSVSGRTPTTHHIRPRDLEPFLPRTVFQEREGRTYIQADYSGLEMRIAAELGRAIETAEALMGNDRTGDYTSHSSSMGCMAPHTPEYTPGGAALQYEATTRIRIPRSAIREGRETECIDITVQKFIPGRTTLLPIECVRQSVGETPEVRPKKSVWQWLLTPIC